MARKVDKRGAKAARRDLEAQWEKVEVQFKASNEEEEIADKEKVRMGHASIPGLI